MIRLGKYQEVKYMMKLNNFVGMMTGHFDNKDQFNKMQAEGKTYPYAEHVNTICNDKINNLPEDFKGKFVVEESYYECFLLGKHTVERVCSGLSPLRRDRLWC